MPKLFLLSQDKIIKAIGNQIKASEEIKSSFAKNLLEELERVFAASTTAFPEKKVVDDFIAKITKLRELAAILHEDVQKNTFVNSLLGVAMRNIPKKKYRSVDVQDIWALAKVSDEWARNIRFLNKRKGPDTRLALQVALTIAERYKKSFKDTPGIGGQGKVESRSEKIKFHNTPYQRICDIVAETKKIKIGRPIQEEAIRLLEAGQQPAPFFRPDVQSLPEKKTY